MSRFCVISICAVSLLLSGCGGSDAGRKNVYPVSGTIKFLGSPIVGAVVSFTPKDGQPAAVGRTDDSGNYFVTTYEAADGAAAGNYAVVVMKFDSPLVTDDTEDEGHSADPNVTASDDHAASSKKKSDGILLPPAYANADSTPLKVEVTAGGENKFDFELK